MKKWMTLLVAVLAMVMVGCGKSECEKCADVLKDAYEEACKGKNCTYCDCYKQKGKYFNPATTKCEDVPQGHAGNTDEKCEGESLEAAKTCLEKKDTFKNVAKANADLFCK